MFIYILYINENMRKCSVLQEIAVLQSSIAQLKEIQQRLKDSKENAALLTPDTEGMCVF